MLVGELKQAKDEMADQDMDPFASVDHVVRSLPMRKIFIFFSFFVYCFLFL